MGIWKSDGEFPGRGSGGEDLVEEIIRGEGRWMEDGSLKVVVELRVVGLRWLVTAVAMEVGEGVGESHISPARNKQRSEGAMEGGITEIL